MVIMYKRLIGGFIILACMFSAAFAYASARRDCTISGVIIYISQDVIEVKRGKREMLISITPNTVFRTQQGNTADRSILELCATVRVQYERQDSGFRAVQVQLLREGYCHR
ncbi:MAG: hypothetical protein N2316_12225 [Spirochaetes bacterium]|nr:hypothetical protein [Spirochaetota bacterium]